MLWNLLAHQHSYVDLFCLYGAEVCNHINHGRIVTFDFFTEYEFYGEWHVFTSLKKECLCVEQLKILLV